MVVRVKEKFEKTKHFKIMKNLKSIFYEEKEIRDKLIEFYLIKRYLKIPLQSRPEIKILQKIRLAKFLNLLFLAHLSEHSWQSSS